MRGFTCIQALLVRQQVAFAAIQALGLFVQRGNAFGLGRLNFLQRSRGEALDLGLQPVRG